MWGQGGMQSLLAALGAQGSAATDQGGSLAGRRVLILGRLFGKRDARTCCLDTVLEEMTEAEEHAKHRCVLSWVQDSAWQLHLRRRLLSRTVRTAPPP